MARAPAFRITAILVFLSALCVAGTAQRSLAASLRVIRAPAPTERVLYSFKGGSDGAEPQGDLIYLNGVLYGTTYGGGTHGDGIVFAVTPSGDERVLYRFKGAPDGANPAAGLIFAYHELYGTTAGGGTGGNCWENYFGGCGTVFRVSTSGVERVLHSFTGSPYDEPQGPVTVDGADPQSRLLAAYGMLFGTTYDGGTDTCQYTIEFVGCGIVFQINVEGEERMLASLWDAPLAGVIAFDGRLYGITSGGNFLGGTLSSGSIFDVNAAGVADDLYDFQNGEDAFGTPLDVAGTMYGTTTEGGTDSAGSVFAATPTGAVRELYSFTGGVDGATPTGALIDVNGELYGTASEGGMSGKGTVFEVSPSGQERTLYQFKGAPDGSLPYAGLTYAAGRLYGTTAGGGAQGHGTVFEVSI